jgi:serine/threonine protein kinase
MRAVVALSSSVESSPPARFPRRYGDRYVLLKQLGEGGMGEVFMAVAGRAGVSRVCALKIVRDFQPDRNAEDLTQRFLDEAKVVTQLSHENLVYVFDFGIADRKGYLAMEYVPGKTLTEVWNRCATNKVGFPTGVALFMISELVAALGYAHKVGSLSLVHRDISPSNVMLAYTGGVKLIDFGLAKWKSKVSETATGINWGKINYMSPEQQQAKPLDNRSDLYSAGVILWEMLTGRQLFPSGKARAAIRQIPPPSSVNPSLSPAIDAVVMKALATAPSDRFQTGEQMSAAIATELPRHAGKRQLVEFMERLFETDKAAEDAEQAALLARAAELGDAMPVGISSSGGENRRDPLVGTVLADRYYVRRWIGQGAMGRVYEGHHTGVGKRVAIKIPRNTERRKNILLQRFRREAQAASQIGHPNIADVTDCGTTPGGDFFFVMEFVDGVDLEKLVKRDGALPLERVMVIGLQMARALEAAHQAGIIHRDLKPSNVMLVRGREEAELVKVLDFGVAKFLRGDGGGSGGEAAGPELTQHDAAVGTPRYMAPEQIGAGQEVDFRADIYAVGGILYFMLTGGRAPVEGDSVERVWHRKLNEDPTPLRSHRPDLPAELEMLVMSCLARAPQERPASMNLLKTALVAALERVRAMESGLLPVKAPSETAVVSSPIGWPRLVAVAGLAGLVAIAGGMTWQWTRRGPGPNRTGEAALLAPTPPLSTSTTVSPPPAAPAGDLPRVAERPEARRSPPHPAPRKAAPAAPAPPPDRASIDRQLATAEQYFQNADFTQALIEANKAVRMGGATRASLLVAKIQLAMEDPAEAAETYSQVLADDPANETALKGLARARARLPPPK